MLSSSKQKWILAALIVSLCVNLFLVGGMAGGLFHKSWRKGDDRLPAFVMMTAPDDLKPVIREYLEKSNPEAEAESAALKEEMRAKRLRIADALAAEPFDRARLEAELLEMRNTIGEMRSRTHRRIAEIAAELTPEQRRQWAEGWREERGH
jgi:uncharacterized membrane protein